MKHSKVFKRRRSSRKLLLSIVVLLVVAAGVLAYLEIKPDQKANSSRPASHSTNTNSPTAIAGNYLFSGTIVLARDVAKYADGNYNQPFSGMATLGTYDAHIGILECPITTNYDSYENEVDNLVFNCTPDWVPYLKKYFQVLNLSSDHLNDQGPQGIADTFKYLSQADIQTVGTYNPASLSDDCKAIMLPVRLIRPAGSALTSSLPVAMCSYNFKELFSPEPGELQSIEKWSKLMPTIALLNEGPEYAPTASPQTVAIAHQMIDYGADFVVGNGTHVVQNTEVYKGKLIVYSMGNFIFDQIAYDDRIALNLAVSMSIPYNQNAQKWLALSPRCLSAPENCLTLAQAQKLVKLHPTYQFNAVGSYGGDGLVATKANAQQQADIEQIANWQATEKQLEQVK